MHPAKHSIYHTPFGSMIENRSWTAGSGYRFGFNGMEGDPEVAAGEGNSYTAAYWQYDARLGRRWNIDPIVKPWESSYATFANNPMYYVDPSGLNGEKSDEGEEQKPDIKVSSTPGVAPNGDMLVGGNVYIQASLGQDDDGNEIYRTVGIQKGDKSYIWNNDKGWYYDSDGNEYNNPWYMDVTNAVGDLVEPTVNMAVDWVEQGDPLYSIKQTFEQSESKNWAGFLAQSFVDGTYQAWGDFKAGGYKRQQLLLNMFVGITSAGASPSTLFATSTTRNILQDILHIKTLKGNVDIPSGSAMDAISIGKAWVNGNNIKMINMKGNGFGWTDGTRSFRISYKPKSGTWKANFQENTISATGKVSEIRNVHMTITN